MEREENEHRCLQEQKGDGCDGISGGENNCFLLLRAVANDKQACDSETKKENRDEKKVGDDLIERAGSYKERGDESLNYYGTSRRAETRMNAGHGFQEQAVASHRVINARR